MATFRLIIGFDIEAASPTEAYGKLRPKVEAIGIPWETMDEWYEHDKDEPGDPGELCEAIETCFDREREASGHGT